MLDVRYALACRRVHYERPRKTLRQVKEGNNKDVITLKSLLQK